LLKLSEVLLREVREAGHNVLSDELLRCLDFAVLRDLHLKFTFPEFKVHDLLDAGGRSWRYDGFMFGHLVPAGDAEVDTAFPYEGGDVCCGQEDQGKR
jgi:hypothetical protein